jgi:hypothetical protein
MRLTRVVSKRNATLGAVIAIALVLGAVGVVLAQSAPAQPQAAAAQKPVLVFQGDLGQLLVYVKPDKTADFEAFVAKYKEALVKLDTPETKQQAASVKVYKAPVAPNATNVLYVVVAEQPVKGVEYWFLPVLYKAFPAEAQSFLDKWNDFKGTVPAQPLDLTLLK